MTRSIMTSFVPALAIIITATVAVANPIPDFGNSALTIGCPAGATVYVLPDGGGVFFTQAHSPDGTVVDATIWLTLLDSNGDPYSGWPAEDIWLQTSESGLVSCLHGTIADSDTDDSGTTCWQQPMRAGGHAFGETVEVVVDAWPLPIPGVFVDFNSADIDGNLIVNLTDLTLFTMDYLGAFDPRSDFFRDGQLDLADLTRFTQALGAVCY